MSKLIPKNIASKIPKLYTTEHEDISKRRAYVRLSIKGTDWSWYVLEYDGDDTCFGLVVGHEKEFGYFELSDLENAVKNNPLLEVERDESFKPKSIVELLTPGSREGA